MSDTKYDIEWQRAALAEETDVPCYLIAENMHGPMFRKQAKEQRGTRVFYCGHCSVEGRLDVFHNLIGRHIHFGMVPFSSDKCVEACAESVRQAKVRLSDTTRGKVYPWDE